MAKNQNETKLENESGDTVANEAPATTPAKPAVAVGDYAVAPGISVSTLRGVVEAGESVSARDFHRGQADIDDLVVAESLQGGGVIARNLAVRLGLTHVPGMADNRHCAAGLSAVQIASAAIIAGMDEVVVAGGTESMTNMVMALKRAPFGTEYPSSRRNALVHPLSFTSADAAAELKPDAPEPLTIRTPPST